MLKRINLSYRSFEQADLDQMGDVNIFIGPNNSGKSSIFQALYELSEYFRWFYKQSPEQGYGFSPWESYGSSEILEGEKRVCPSGAVKLELSCDYLGINQYLFHNDHIGFVF